LTAASDSSTFCAASQFSGLPAHVCNQQEQDSINQLTLALDDTLILFVAVQQPCWVSSSLSAASQFSGWPGHVCVQQEKQY
jgi:hypothetical protein